MRLHDLQSVSDHLGFAPQNLYYLVELRDSLYIRARIPKRSGKSSRQIYIPNTELKGVQREILRKLLYQWPVSDKAFAYVPGRSLIDAANKLSGEKAVLRIDIRDFFPSISAGRVYRLFEDNGVEPRANYVLTRLVTFDDKLTQGSPTSPYLSNLVLKKLDNWLSRFARRYELEYIRYSDDLFFYRAHDFSHRTFVPYIREIVNKFGFKLNNSKQRYHRRGKPRYILGLATHGQHPQIPRAKRRTIRAAFYNASKNIRWASDNFQTLSGMAEWYKVVYGETDHYQDYKRVLENVRKTQFHQPFSI